MRIAARTRAAGTIARSSDAVGHAPKIAGAKPLQPPPEARILHPLQAPYVLLTPHAVARLNLRSHSPLSPMLRLLPLAFLLASVSCLAQSGTVRGDVGAALNTYLTESVSPDFSGVVLAVQDGEVVLRKGYGMADRAAGVANTPETVFQIGSVTKPVTAVAVMTLVDQGLVDPSDLVSAYFDGVPEDKATMTVHHLLTHTAGFPNAIGDDYAAIGRDAYIRLAMQTPLATPPGEAYAYSNVGYALLGAIIEEVTGMSYDAYLQSVMRPIGAAATGYRLGDEHAYAHAYEGSHDLGLPFDRPWAEDGPYWHLRANGGLLSTVDDLYALHLALEEGRLLSPEAYRAMHTEQTDEGRTRTRTTDMAGPSLRRRGILVSWPTTAVIRVSQPTSSASWTRTRSSSPLQRSRGGRDSAQPPAGGDPLRRHARAVPPRREAASGVG